MGMFDYIKIDSSIKLPVSKEFRSLKIDPHTLELQTKSIENTLSTFIIKKNKRIYKDNKKINYHGIIDFGTCYVTDTVTYCLDYEAKFSDGLLKNIKLSAHKTYEHESRQKQHEKILEKSKKNNDKFLRKFLLFIEKVFVLYPLNFLGLNFYQGFWPGSLRNKNYLITFHCPKLVFGYKKDHKDNTYGISIDKITTELCFHKSVYAKEFSCKLLGFGFVVSKFDNYFGM